MKQVIQGRIYNTETGIEIAFASRGNSRDFRAYEETLYKSPRGRFFLAGKGGPMTQWARGNAQDGYWGSSGIIALTEDGAREWCERHCIKADIVAEHFEVEEA